MITADVELPALLEHIVEEACTLVNARYGALGVLNEDRTGLEQFVTVGLDDEEERAIGDRPTGRGVLGLLITDPSSLRMKDLSSSPDRFGFPANHPPMTSFLGVPIRVREGRDVYGNLYLTDKIGASAFSDEDEALAEGLALVAGIAIESTRLHDRVRVLGVLDDRDRIAMALHDTVIQRLYASGLALQAASRLSEREPIVERIGKVVEDLDDTIDQIRTTIFELGRTGGAGLRRSVLVLTDELAPMLGSRPEVSFLGAIDLAVPQRVSDHVLAVLRESLTNAGRHASATRYIVRIRVDDRVSLEVVDNGSGFDASTLREGGMGLRNLRSRAERLGGSFEIAGATGGGTKVSWEVPLVAPERKTAPEMGLLN